MQTDLYIFNIYINMNANHSYIFRINHKNSSFFSFSSLRL